MGVEAVQPVFRDIPAASAVPQCSLTRADRELQMEEGQPPMETASVEQATLRWRKDGDQEKWRNRLKQRVARGAAASSEVLDEILEANETQDEALEEGQEYSLEDASESEEEAGVTMPDAAQGRMSPQEEETGTLFDGRS